MVTSGRPLSAGLRPRRLSAASALVRRPFALAGAGGGVAWGLPWRPSSHPRLPARLRRRQLPVPRRSVRRHLVPRRTVDLADPLPE